MANLERDGVRIHYEDHGAGAAVLLTHGYGASARMWEPQIAALAGSYRLVTWDMRGHDRTDSPDDPSLYSREATVADMAAVLDACGIDDAVIGGLSLGGYMSLAFYVEHHERVRALMLFDCGPGYKNESARATWNEWAERRARQYEVEGLAAGSESPEVLAAKHAGAAGLAHAARGMLTQEDARAIEALPRIDVPTLIVVGSKDEDFIKPSEYMAARIPNATKVVIDGAGHAPNIEKPAVFNATVAAFLASL
jgi:pimeloyl-ACP methyl ester carboxylesterase